MSFLINPSFEGKEDHWVRINYPNSTTLEFNPVLTPAGQPVPPKSGSLYLSLTSSQAAGSVGQDVVIPERLAAISAFAWVRAGDAGSVRGALNIWQLDTDPDRAMSAPFVADGEWSLVTSTLDFPNPADRKTIRIEFYVLEPNKSLLVDSVNAF
ncbi:hypothetical protein ACFZCP_05835 [Streptomyces sp. NPDC007971]|uniref:hypothetical protein n=1 Tax=Streptomyces sp. NPDC007971 TaxID=3364799 RepID=UPI0036E2F4CA